MHFLDAFRDFGRSELSGGHIFALIEFAVEIL